jgi:hypothetical protein
MRSVVVAGLMAGATACSATNTAAMKTETDNDKLFAGIEAPEPGTDGKAHTELTFYVSNRGDADIQMLVWNTPFEKILSADVFSVKHDGETMPYNGRKIKRGTPQPENYLTVHAGERLETILDISAYYDMDQPGEYSVAYNPVNIDGSFQMNGLTPVNQATDAVTMKIVGH